MKIFVGGSLRAVPRDAERCGQFVQALGAEIVRQGHVLLNGCRSTLDQEIASAANEWLTRNAGDPKAKIVSYCLKCNTPVHLFGTVRDSVLLDWQMTHAELEVPEQIALADSAIFVAGSEGTFWSRNWASWARKPIFGIPCFGGAGETIYKQELRRLRDTSPVVAQEYEKLNSRSLDIADYAQEVVRRVTATPRNVFLIMSFKREYRDVLASYKAVCEEFNFEAGTDERKPSEHIVPRIEAGIRNSAFVIADLSEPSQNVFYELGYAMALGKTVFVTAKEGTKLPFDLGDLDTIFWNIQEDLKNELRKRFGVLAVKYGE